MLSKCSVDASTVERDDSLVCLVGVDKLHESISLARSLVGLCDDTRASSDSELVSRTLQLFWRRERRESLDKYVGGTASGERKDEVI